MRVLLRFLSPLLGLAVAAFGTLLALEVSYAWVRPQARPLVVPWAAWRDTVAGLTWTSGWVRGIAIGLGVVGLLLLLVALNARRHDVGLTDPGPDVTVTTSPRSLARLVGHEVRELDDVVSASVVASRRKVSVRAASREPAATVKQSVQDRVAELLDALPLNRTPKVAVTVAPSKEVL